MENKGKKIIIVIETILIIVLIILALEYYNKNKKIAEERESYYQGLVSPRIYAGVISPKNYMIQNFVSLDRTFEKYLNETKLNISIYVENLRDGASMRVNENMEFYPLSLNKLPIAILILKKIEEGKMSLDTMIPIREGDKTDAFGDLYKINTKDLPLRVLLEKMLKESDDTASHALVHYIDENDLNLLYDYYSLDFNVYYPSRKNYGDHTGLVKTLTYANVFRSLYLSSVLDTKDSEYILYLLTDTVFDVKKFANLPENVTVSHKFGEYYTQEGKYFHDCGIIYIENSRVLYCIMTKDLDESKAIDNVSQIVNSVYKYILNERAILSKYKNAN